MSKEYIDKYWSKCRGYVYVACQHNDAYSLGDGYQTVSMICLSNIGKDDKVIHSLCIEAINKEIQLLGKDTYSHYIDDDGGEHNVTEHASFSEKYNDYTKQIICDIDDILNNEEKVFLNDIFGLNKKGLGFRGYSTLHNIPIEEVKNTLNNIRTKVKSKINIKVEDII